MGYITLGLFVHSADLTNERADKLVDNLFRLVNELTGLGLGLGHYVVYICQNGTPACSY